MKDLTTRYTNVLATERDVFIADFEELVDKLKASLDKSKTHQESIDHMVTCIKATRKMLNEDLPKFQSNSEGYTFDYLKTLNTMSEELQMDLIGENPKTADYIFNPSNNIRAAKGLAKL